VTRLLAALRPPTTARREEPVDRVVRALDKRLLVTVEEGTIQLRLDWPDAQRAYLIVQAAVQSFLEARHVQEVTYIDDVIAHLEGRMATLKSELDAAAAAARVQRSPGSRSGAGRDPGPSADLTRLRSLVDAKARAAQDVEEFRSRRLAELESQLSEARAKLSERHPTVMGLRREIEGLSRESPSLRALREDERALLAEYTAQLANEGQVPSSARATETGGVAGLQREEDPRVRDLRLKYEQMAGRVISARADRDAATAAFKYRYNVIWPPEVPTEPYSPNPVKVLGIGFAVSLLLALLAAVLPDLVSGRVVERWQVERQLNLPVLGEISSRSRG
jgi:hypothetical protein